MSEADSPLDRHFESTVPSNAPLDSRPDAHSVDAHPAEVLAASEAHPPDSEWHTVDFPGAIRVDAIPAQPEADEAERIQHTELHDRLTQLEQDFTQAQIEWQLETARLLHQVSESTPPEQAEAVQTQLSTAQEQLSRLFRELELSHQATQRQQILVETLTEQLESGQERIAELERDCATAQQRYNEQVQQRLQAESDCRDLRIRLNRQQQHTLQFKVALEKCLEMPASAVRAVPTDSVLLESENFAAEAIAAPQNSPVRPWSAPASPSSLKPLFPSLSSLGAFNIESGTAPLDSLPAPVEENLQSDASDAADLMNLIFPVQSPAPSIAESTTLEQPPSPIFDISPLLATDAVDPAASLQEVSDALWQDLTHLLEPQTAVEAEAEFKTAEFEAAELKVSEAIEGSSASTSAADATASTLPGTVLSSPTTGQGGKVSVSSLPLSPSPSPVVYPLRPAKKRQSLAAVELPTFPRKQ